MMMSAQVNRSDRQGASRTIASPVGPLALTVRDGRIVRLGFGEGPGTGPRVALLDRAKSELHEYFRRERQAFDLPVAPPADGLLGRVLAALARIPYGETISYKDLTLELGLDVSHVREVGAALGRNPIAIVIPCHRVIGSDGSLVGFGGGIERKRRLLDIESPQLQLA
jgi:methylated-DNA-[protein]-cysteine S-methyltransferase